MSAIRLLAITVTACLLSLTAQTSRAQSLYPSSHYQPVYPTLSPWFQMYTSNTGALDNYHTYVRPEMLLRDRLQRQNTINAMNDARIANLRADLNGLSTEAAVRPTGTNSVFMDYSHYYSSQQHPRPGLRR
jgi:hypothetical protein